MTIRSALKKIAKGDTPAAPSAPPTDDAPSASAILTAAAAPAPSPMDDDARISAALTETQAEVKRLTTARQEATLNAELAAPADAVAAEQRLADVASELAAALATVTRLQSAKAAAGRAAARQRNANKRAADAARLLRVAQLCEARGELAAKIDGIARDLRREYEAFVKSTEELTALVPRDLVNGGSVLNQTEVDGAMRLTLRQVGFDWAIQWIGAVPSMSDRVSAGNYHVAQKVDPDFGQRTAN